jgi:hypothetical protein
MLVSLMIAASLQATSVINIPLDSGYYGVSIYNFVALIIGVGFLKLVYYNNKSIINLFQNRLFVILGAYVLVSIFGAFLLPHVNVNLPVNLLMDMDGANVPPVPLRFTLANIVQAINLIVIYIILIWILCALKFAINESSKNKIPSFLFIYGGLLVAGCISLYERIAEIFGFYSIANLFVNNTGYNLVAVDPWNAIRRIAVPFAEPSYASILFSSAMVGMLAIFLFGKSWKLAGAGFLFSAVALFNCLGSTGLAAGAVSLVLILFYSWVKAFSKKTGYSQKIRAFCSVVILILVTFASHWAWKYSPYSSKIDKSIQELVIVKAQVDFIEGGGRRHKSNARAIQITVETYGLGVGLGSNRASSFFASLISNTGVIGFALFSIMLGSIFLRYYREKNLTDNQLYIGVSLGTATLGMGLGIPDLNFPLYWGFIFMAFLFLPEGANKFQGIDAGPHNLRAKEV